MLFTAYSIVRTVPSANRPNRKKKKTTNKLDPCVGSRVKLIGNVENQHGLTCSKWQWVVHIEVSSLLHFAFTWHASICLIQVFVSVNSVFKEQMRSAVDRQDPQVHKWQTI